VVGGGGGIVGFSAGTDRERAVPGGRLVIWLRDGERRREGEDG
jgi:hypothetical protein